LLTDQTNLPLNSLQNPVDSQLPMYSDSGAPAVGAMNFIFNLIPMGGGYLETPFHLSLVITTFL